jgi:hypothetical protein
MGGSVILRALSDHPDPRRVVQAALRERDRDRRAAEQAGDPAEVYDGVWAVVDIDTHPHLREAIASAKKAGIAVALSGPCFETWLILHLENRTASFPTSKQAKAHWATLVEPGRTTDQQFARLSGKVLIALDRANTLAARHDTNNVPRHERNPSSEIGNIISVICDSAHVDLKTL